MAPAYDPIQPQRLHVRLRIRGMVDSIQPENEWTTIEEQEMNEYLTSTPRAPLAIAAVVMTTITLGLSVLVPATMDAGTPQFRAMAAPSRVAPPVTEVAVVPPRIDSIEVVAVREPTPLTAVQVRGAPTKRRQG
jgi:hypothetical protein